MPRDFDTEFALVVDGQSRVWISGDDLETGDHRHGGYVAVFEQDRWQMLPDSPLAYRLAAGRPNEMYASGWWHGESGVFRYRGQWEKVWGVEGATPLAIAADAAGGAWVAYSDSARRLAYVRDGAQTEFAYPTLLEGEQGLWVSMLVDRDAHLWVADGARVFVLQDGPTSVGASSWAGVKAERR